MDLHDVKPVLELHKLEAGEPYYLAMLLVGAYQEVMGNNHNLFGVPHEAHVHWLGRDTGSESSPLGDDREEYGEGVPGVQGCRQDNRCSHGDEECRRTS